MGAEVAEAPVVPQDIVAGVGVDAAMAVERFTPIPAASANTASREGRGERTPSCGPGSDYMPGGPGGDGGDGGPTGQAAPITLAASTAARTCQLNRVPRPIVLCLPVTLYLSIPLCPISMPGCSGCARLCGVYWT